jgi:hypothetical protein
VIPPGGEPLHPLDSRPDPVDAGVYRGVLFGCGVEALVGVALLLIAAGLGLAFGWWRL